jgi:prepilin-type N-terminal cleavage/methylation domain-containing protein
MTLHQRARDAGFTLIEMMITVAIIGILAAIAVPSFIKYQNTSKRAEAYSNLASLAKSQKSFYAEFGRYLGVPSEPLGLTGLVPTSTKRDSTGWDATPFAAVGWSPEGDVFFDYDTNTPDLGGCPCTSCFTAAAYGDLDGNTALSVMLYVQPDPSGATWCQTALVPQDPPLSAGGNRIFNQVVRSQLSDEF